MTSVLGISAFYHDSAAAIIVDGEIIAAAQEERFTRKKHDASYPKNAINYVLKEAGLKLNEVDHVVFYEKPFLKFERLLETYVGFSPSGFKSFSMSMPLWLSEKLFQKKMLFDALKEQDNNFNDIKKINFSEHHLSHAASAFFSSPYEEAIILTLDGVGEWATTTVSLGKNNKINILKEIHFPHSLGLLYSAFTYFLGFKVNSGEYKVMGMAPYGDPSKHDFSRLVKFDGKNFEINTKFVNFIELQSYKNFISLQKESFFIISDSGTAQEEPALFFKPVIVPRDFSERPQSYNNNCSFKLNINNTNLSWKKSIQWIKNHKNGKIRMNNNWLGKGDTSKRIINILKQIL